KRSPVLVVSVCRTPTGSSPTRRNWSSGLPGLATSSRAAVRANADVPVCRQRMLCRFDARDRPADGVDHERLVAAKLVIGEPHLLGAVGLLKDDLVERHRVPGRGAGHRRCAELFVCVDTPRPAALKL